MKGTWQGSGTWQTGGGTGIGAVLATVAAAAAVLAAVSWIVAWWWLLLGGAAACAVTAAVAVRFLVRWSDRRAAAVWAQRPASLRAEPVRQVPAAERPAIPQTVVFNFFTPDGGTHAAIIRKAITGTAGDDTRKE